MLMKPNPNNAKIIIREVKIGDERGIARAHAAGWKAAYRGIFPDEILDGMSEEKGGPRFREAIEKRLSDDNAPPFLLAEIDGGIAGFASSVTPPQQAADIYDCEIKAIYVDPRFHRLGIGKKLVSETAKRFFDQGKRAMLIMTADGNPYRAFYEKLGGKPVEGLGSITVGGKEVPLIGFGWKDIRSLF